MNARALSFGLVAAVMLSSSLAFGQDVATAEALFNKGVADLQAGKLDSACPAIGESYRIDPRPGTLFTLAECYAKAGKTASAAARYQDYIELFARLPPDLQAKQHGRDKAANEAKAALTPDVPMLTVTLGPGAPDGTVVKRDDVVLGGPALGLPLPVDPGEHVVTVLAPNGDTATEKFTLTKGEKKSVVLAPKAGTGGGAAVVPAGSSGPAGSDSRRKTQRLAGFVAGGVGAAGLIVGGITGALTLAKKSDITANCDTSAGTCRNATGKSAVDSAQTTGLISTIGFIVGGVGLAGGAVLILTAPKKSDAALDPGRSAPRALLAPTVRAGVLDASTQGASFGFNGSF